MSPNARQAPVLRTKQHTPRTDSLCDTNLAGVRCRTASWCGCEGSPSRPRAAFERKQDSHANDDLGSRNLCKTGASCDLHNTCASILSLLLYFSGWNCNDLCSRHGAASEVPEKAVFEHFLGAEKSGFGGGASNRKDRGRFFDRPFLELFKFDDDSEFPRQGPNRFVQESLFVFLREQRFGAGRWILYGQVVRGVIGELQEELTPLSQLHQRRIDRNSCGPGKKARAFVERGEIPKRV